jgi:hypothetical protein
MTVAYVCREHSWHTHDPDSRCPQCKSTPRFSAEERAALEGGLNALGSNLRDREEDLREEIESHIQDPETQRFMQENIDNIRAEIATLRKMLEE